MAAAAGIGAIGAVAATGAGVQPLPTAAATAVAGTKGK